MVATTCSRSSPFPSSASASPPGVVVNNKDITPIVGPSSLVLSGFRVHGDHNHTTTFSSNTDITVSGETMTYHTSCSVPLYLGQKVRFAAGDLTVTGFETEEFDDTVCKTCFDTVDECPVCDACGLVYNHMAASNGYDFGSAKTGKSGGKSGKSGGKSKVRVLMMEYTGGDTSVSNDHGGKTTVTGASVSDATATIQCGSDAAASVALGEVFNVTINAHYTECTIGSSAQTVKLHSSCSSSIITGDKYGALTVSSFVLDNGLTAKDVCQACTLCYEYNATQMLACTPEFGIAAGETMPSGAELFFQGEQEHCDRVASDLNAYFDSSDFSCGLDANSVLVLVVPNGSTASTDITSAAQFDQQAGSSLPAVAASLSPLTSDTTNSFSYIKPDSLFACRRIAFELNAVVRATEGIDLCTSEEQARYAARSCNDALGLTQKDCELPFLYGGLAVRPSDPEGAGYPQDQTFRARPFVGQNTKTLLQKQAGDPDDLSMDAWFSWNFFNSPVPVPAGYEECDEDDANSIFYDCSIDFTGQTGLEVWDERCFETMAVKYLPDPNTGRYPVTQAEKDSAAKPTTAEQGGNQYNAVCNRALQRPIRTCSAPLFGSSVGVKSMCACGDAYLKEGFVSTCANTYVGVPSEFEGAACNSGNLRVPNVSKQRAPRAAAVVGRPSLHGSIDVHGSTDA